VRTCEFVLEDLRLRSLPLALLACFEEVVSRMLKNVIGEQTIHRIFDILERRLDIWEERGDVIGSQARSNPTGDFSLRIAMR